MQRYNLLLYPPITEVAEQLTRPNDSLGRFGNYKGRIPGVSYADAELGKPFDIVKDFFIAPERIERVESELGRVAIYGKTAEGEYAKVDVNPFADPDSFGTLEIGEVDEQKMDAAHAPSC